MSYTAYIIVYTVHHWVQSQYTHTYMTEWWVTQCTSQYTLCIIGYNHSTPIHTWLSDELHSVHHSIHCVSLGTITVHPYIHDWVMSYTAYITVYTVYRWVQSQYTHTYMTEWWVTQRTSQYTLCIVGYNHSTPIHTWPSDELHSVHHSIHCVSLGTITVHPYIHDWVISYTAYIIVYTVYHWVQSQYTHTYMTEWWVTQRTS